MPTVAEIKAAMAAEKAAKAAANEAKKTAVAASSKKIDPKLAAIAAASIAKTSGIATPQEVVTAPDKTKTKALDSLKNRKTEPTGLFGTPSPEVLAMLQRSKEIAAGILPRTPPPPPPSPAPRMTEAQKLEKGWKADKKTGGLRPPSPARTR